HKALLYYQVSVAQGGKSAAIFLSRVFGSETPPASAMWYAPAEKLREAYYSIYKKLEADPDLRFPNLREDYPLSPHPTPGDDAD
ncbi:tetratricopeptide repeat protein, partial [Pseudomonas aeruginosa]